MRVITGGLSSEDPLSLEPMRGDFKQMWIFCQPDNDSRNPCFVVMNVFTAYVWHVHGGHDTPGTYVEVYTNIYGDHTEQFYFFNDY